MRRKILIIILLAPMISFSQGKMNFQKADSLSYQYFLQGDWSNLISLTKDAFKQNIDSKFMRQRAGYAYFMTADYFSAKIQYEKALNFDRSDDVTREYLYYSSANAGSEHARYYAGKLSEVAAKRLGIQPFNLAESFDTEFNLKTNQLKTRSNQIYYRVGLNSELGYRVSLYQAVSYYQQTVSKELTRQPEYLALLKWSVNPSLQIKTAYHRLFTNVAGANYPANLGFVGLSSQLKRFHFEVNGSVLKSDTSSTRQIGLQAGVVLPGKSNLYFTGSLAHMTEATTNRIIYSQSAGFKLTGNWWAEGNITLGNLKNYNTFNSLYVYNSVDPTVFRTGLSLICFAGKHLVVTGNYTFNQQEIERVSTNKNYYQHSFSIALKWKL
jgi:hypothetical protein